MQSFPVVTEKKVSVPEFHTGNFKAHTVSYIKILFMSKKQCKKILYIWVADETMFYHRDS